MLTSTSFGHGFDSRQVHRRGESTYFYNQNYLLPLFALLGYLRHFHYGILDLLKIVLLLVLRGSKNN